MKERSAIPRTVIMLGMVSLCTDVATEMIYPLIPVFITALGAGAVALGVIEGIAETTASILKLYSGVLSDKLQKRKLLVVIGYSLSSFIRPLTAIVSSAWQIVAIRMVDRIGKGIRTAPRDALIVDSVDDSIRGRAYGFHRAMDHAGAVLGPLVAIAVLIFLILAAGVSEMVTALRLTFGLALLPGLVAVAILLLFVKETASPIPPARPVSFSFANIDRNFLRYLLIITVFTLGNSSDAFLLYRLQETLRVNAAVEEVLNQSPLFRIVLAHLGGSETQQTIVAILFLPLIWSFFHIIKVLFSTLLGGLSDRIGRKVVIIIGWSIYALVYVCFAALGRLPEGMQIVAMFVLFGAYAFYYAFTEGAEKAFVADLVRETVRGSAFGLYNFASGIGSLPASILFGLLYARFGPEVAFGTGAAIACISILLLTFLVHEEKNRYG